MRQIYETETTYRIPAQQTGFPAAAVATQQELDQVIVGTCPEERFVHLLFTLKEEIDKVSETREL